MEDKKVKYDRGTAFWRRSGSQIAQAVREIRTGSVEVTISDGQVVQIERLKKLCFELKPNPARTMFYQSND